MQIIPIENSNWHQFNAIFKQISLQILKMQQFSPPPLNKLLKNVYFCLLTLKTHKFKELVLLLQLGCDNPSKFSVVMYGLLRIKHYREYSVLNKKGQLPSPVPVWLCSCWIRKVCTDEWETTVSIEKISCIKNALCTL